MAGKKGGADVGGKKASGQARKAEAAAQKVAAENAKLQLVEDDDWRKGEKSTAKKEAEKAKKEELARKKAEREALEAAEAASLPSRAGPKKAKAAPKKTKGLDLSQLDGDDNVALPALNATGIENALDALSVAGGSDAKVDKHPERRFKAAYAQFEQRRLSEMEKDGSGVGLRQNQKQMKIKKEFEKSPENPFNQMTARYDATKEELEGLKKQEKTKIEKTLAEQN
ncbi:hypothetical protein B0T24DRAFT_175994 [Lasiosphaeria ovina]|uniref:DUF1014-domain-containing protein n=1 Tax=Lasiosphaeria ovina TaxID=92902 RepID=A0AAE0TTW0_9PEZI|nr:hypothetical protein B0T24DRAFT_175994 [Lasiosphaeria ovina]